jgi:hypothetical protein
MMSMNHDRLLLTTVTGDWNGKTNVIFQDIIYRLAEEGAFGPPGGWLDKERDR